MFIRGVLWSGHMMSSFIILKYYPISLCLLIKDLCIFYMNNYKSYLLNKINFQYNLKFDDFEYIVTQQKVFWRANQLRDGVSVWKKEMCWCWEHVVHSLESIDFSAPFDAKRCLRKMEGDHCPMILCLMWLLASE